MTRKARRATAVPRLESLEPRTLLSADPAPSAAVLWAGGATAGVASEVLIRFTAGTTPARQHADLALVGGRLVWSYPDGPSLVALPPWLDRPAALAVLGGLPDVAYAEANASFHATGVDAAGASAAGPGVHAEAGVVLPNNPGYAREWGMALIDAPNAWGITRGTPATIVAVLDTGLDLSNPAFLGRVWTNPNPNGADGYKGDLHGWNFVDNNANLADKNGHGTHVTGVIAAAGNNGVGIAGLNWGARIMPLKVLDAQGDGSTDAAVSAVYYAVNHGARVINASWGGDVYSKAMLDALNYANAHGAVFVTAAGNESSDNDATPTYPASYHTPNELVVAAVDRTGALASFYDWGSNWGPRTVDVAAPGVDIYSTVVGGFESMSGTSMSTPFVSGTVALLSGAFPTLTAAQLVNRVKATVKPVAALNGLISSPGVVDPYYALVNYVTQGPGAAGSPTSGLKVGGSSMEDVQATILATDAVYGLFGGTPAGYVRGAYQGLYGRGPTPAELTAGLTALQAQGRVGFLQSLQNSTEGRRTRVAQWYRDVLFSSQPIAALKADPGVVQWANLLALGWSDADVLSALVSNGTRYAGLGGTPETYVASLYWELLGRGPEQGAVAYHANAMRTQGVSAVALARGFLASPEGHLTTIARLYQQALGSTASLAALKADGGVAHWAKFLGAD